MTDYVAKIRAKGLDATGVTEDIAREMHAHKGKHYMGIVEFKVDETHDKADGQHKVDLVLTQVEPATDQMLEDHLRELTRTLHQNRVLNSEDQQLRLETGEDLEPSVDAVIAARRAHVANQPHAFDTDGDEDGTPHCLACGDPADADLHTSIEDLDPEFADQGPDPYSFIHAKGRNADVPGSETPCGLRATSDATLATHTDDDQVTCPDCLTALHVDQGDDTDDHPTPDDPAYDPHAFQGAGPEYACIVCDQPADAAIHEDVLVTT